MGCGGTAPGPITGALPLHFFRDLKTQAFVFPEPLKAYRPTELSSASAQRSRSLQNQKTWSSPEPPSWLWRYRCARLWPYQAGYVEVCPPPTPLHHAVRSRCLYMYCALPLKCLLVSLANFSFRAFPARELPAYSQPPPTGWCPTSVHPPSPVITLSSLSVCTSGFH